MKRIAELSDSSAAIVMRKGEVIAKVHTRYGSGGGVQVDVVQYGEPAKRTAAVMGLELDQYGGAPDRATLQQSKAGGYGYDKKTAALSGMIIDGHRLTNHCGTDEKVQRLFKRYTRAIDSGKGPQASEYWEKLARKIGARFANWQGTDAEAIAHHMRRHGGTEAEAREIVGNRNAPPRIGRYTSLYRLEGLRYMEAIGYDVIEVL